MNNTLNIINTSLAFKSRIDDYDYWKIHLRHGQKSDMECQIDNGRINVSDLAKGNIIYNRDELNYPMRITEESISLGKDGDKKTVFAFDVYKIFEGRIANDTTSDITYTNQTVEYIIKDLINKNVVNPTDTDRDVSWLSVESSTTLGSTINYTVPPQGKLYDVVVELLAIDNLGLYANYTSSTIEIDCYEGVDRSQGNTDSNKPVTFSIDFDNLISGEETSSDTFNVNVAYVGGVSSGSRIIQEVGTGTGADRIELAVDGGNTSDTTELTAIGNSALKTTENSGTYNAAVTEDDSFTYGEDFYLGDIVTVIGRNNVSHDLRILEVEIIREQGNYKQINLTFGQYQVKDTTQVTSNTERIIKLESKQTTHRETLTENRNYYVATTGSDGNDGLTSSAPFLTLQHALDVVGMLDISIYNVTINMADGTYTMSSRINLKGCTGSGIITISGNSSTPDNVELDFGFNRGFALTSPISQKYVIENLKITGGSTQYGVYLDNSILIEFDGVHFNGWKYFIRCSTDGALARIKNNDNNTKLTGSPTNAFECLNKSGLEFFAGTVNTDNLTSFSNFFRGTILSGIQLISTTAFTTTAITGRQWTIQSNSVLSTSGITIPGNTVGITATGGQVI